MNRFKLHAIIMISYYETIGGKMLMILLYECSTLNRMLSYLILSTLKSRFSYFVSLLSSTHLHKPTLSTNLPGFTDIYISADTLSKILKFVQLIRLRPKYRYSLNCKVRNPLLHRFFGRTSQFPNFKNTAKFGQYGRTLQL